MKKFLLLFFRLSLVLFFTFLSVFGWGQVVIATQDFETTPATPTWLYSSNNGAVSNTNTGTPNNQRIRTGARSFQVNNTSSTITFGDVNVSGYNSVKILVRISSISTNSTNGADAADYVRLFTKLNSASFATNTEANSDIAVNGNSNSRWGYNTNGISTNSGTNVVVSGTTGTNQGTVYSTLTINIPNGTNTVGLRLNVLNNDSTEVWCIDDVVIEGSVAGATLTPSSTSLTGFSYIEGIGPSNSQNFNLSGSNLTGFPGNITVTAPTDYEVSLDNTTFTNTVNVPYSSATLASTPIYVRLKAGLSAGNYNGQNITLSGGGVSSAPTIACNGTVNPFVVNFGVTFATINENGTTYAIQVNSNAISNRTVEIAATGGTASNGNQYSFAPITATFASSTTFTTNVTINNNTTCSGNTNVVFSLQNPSSGCTIGANNQLTLSIADDEYFSGTIKSLQFETGDNWPYTGTGGVNSTLNRYYGTQSYRIGGTGNLETDNISIVGYNNVTLKVAYAATNVDSGEDLFLDISYDNGSNWSSTKLVDGFSNANINIGSTNASDPTTVSTNPWVVNIPSTENQIKVRLRTTTNDTTEYYWVDDIILSGQYCVSCSEPTINSVFYANSPQNITTNSVTLNWTSGNGSNRIVILKEDSAVTFVPTDNITYQSNANFGSGTDLGNRQFVVYNGNSNTINVTGLTPGKIYHAAIYEYGCLSGSENYLTTNPAVDFFVVTPENPINLDKVCSSNNTLELSWQPPANGMFDGYIVTVRQGGTPSNVNTIDPTTITNAHPDISLAQTYGVGSYFVYKGTANNVNISGLTNGTSYTFKVYAYTDAGAIYEYSSGTQTTQSVSIPEITSPISFNGNASASITWSNPNSSCFDEVMAVVTTSSGITFLPSGNSYTPNSVYGTPNQVVFKSNANNLNITGLTNGVTYYVEIFVRKGLEWSNGVEVAVTPNALTGTTLQSGDFAIVAINTSAAASSSEDEISFVCFKDITPGTQIYLTDNGYERKFANKWGNSEGIISLLRTNTTLAKGTFVTIRTVNNGVKTGSDFTVYVCGSEDTNWTKDEISSGTFDLNKDDQLWFMQGGIWTNITTGNHDATYNGNILYGWTDIAWKTAPNYADSKGSTIPSGYKCFTTDVNNPEAGASRVQFNYSAYSSLTTNDQLEWIALINNTANWNYYTSNANYYGSSNYSLYNSCTPITIASDTHINGKWNGTQDVNWFNCSNWDTLKVPDQSTNVSFNTTVANNAVIDAESTDSDFYGDVAKAYNLILDKNLTIEASSNNKLEVYGSLTINTGGTLDMDDGIAATQDGQIYLYGNWMNNAGETHFLQGQSTVHFLGSSPQIINGNDHNKVEVFGNVVLGNHFDTSVSNDLKLDGNLTINSGKIIDIKNANHYIDVQGNIINNGTLTVESDANLVQRSNTSTYSGNAITVKRNASMKRLDYTYWGSPVSGQNVRSFSPGTLESRFYVYNESNDYFDGLFIRNKYPNGSLSLTVPENPSSYTFIQGKGYGIRASNYAPTTLQTRTYSFVGVPNNGEITFPLKYSAQGFNLVANPYPSNINFDELYNANQDKIYQTAYFWTNVNPNPIMQGASYPSQYNGTDYFNNYAVYNGSGGVSATSTTAVNGSKTPNQYIKVGQGFIVKAKPAGNNESLIFKNNIRTEDTTGHFFNARIAKPTVDRFWLSLTTPLGVQNDLLIAYKENATNDFELDFDAPLIASPPDSFYSVLGDQKLMIQGRKYPLVIKDRVKLGQRFYQDGIYKISIKTKEGVFAKGQEIYLKDKLKGSLTNLQTSDYTFDATAGETADRFEIVYRPDSTLSTEELSKSQLKVYPTEGWMVIESPEVLSRVWVTDATGKQLYESEVNGKTTRIQSSHYPSGMYYITVETSGGKKLSQKVLKK